MLKKTVCFILATVALIFSKNAISGATSKCNDGLERTVVSVGRNSKNLAVTMYLRNTGKQTAYLMLIGPTSATDSSGVIYRYSRASGITICPTDSNSCIRYLSDHPQFMSNLTRVDPETTLSIIFELFTSSKEAHGGTVNFSTVLAARFVSDLLQDKSLRNDLKVKEMQSINCLSFFGEPVTGAR